MRDEESNKGQFINEISGKSASPGRTAGKALNYKLTDLLDIPLLQQMFSSFYNLTGIMHAVLDVNNNILSSVGWQDICTKFHRSCPEAECRCQQSDSYIAEHLHDGPYVGYRCLNGLMDYATPIIVEGQHLGTIFMGQVLHEAPDEELFCRQAREFEFDETSYIEALHKVRIVPEEQVKSIMDFYSSLGQILASTGLERLRSIERAEDKFAKAFQCNPDPITITTLPDGRYVEVNDAWIKTTGFEREEGIGRTVFDLNIWVSSKERKAMLKQLRECGRIRDFEARLRDKSGEIRIAQVSAEIIDIADSRHLLSVQKDVTESKRTEEALRLSEEKFSRAFNASPNPMSISSVEEGKLLSVNDAFCRLLGYGKAEIADKTAMEIGFWFNSSDRAVVKQRIRSGESVRDLKIYFRKRHGELRKGLFSAERIDVEDNEYMLGIIIDITEHEQNEEQLKYLSIHDKLTGLFNRSFFEEELKRIDRQRLLPLSVIIGDVNGLKTINDKMGCLAGDGVLITVAEILGKSCRKNDIVARWGGDEFIVLLPECSYHAALNILEMIHNNFKFSSSFPMEINISLGLATKYFTIENIYDILKEAEDNMYRNKLLNYKHFRSIFIKRQLAGKRFKLK